MKTSLRFLYVLSVVIALGALASAPLGAQAAQTQPQDPSHDHAAPSPGTQATPGDMATMMAHMQVQQTKLAELVQKMNAAKGAEQVEAMRVLLNTLVQDHQAMCTMMMSHMTPGQMNMMGNMGGAKVPPKD